MKPQHTEQTLANMSLDELKAYCTTFDEVPREVLQATLDVALRELGCLQGGDV